MGIGVDSEGFKFLPSVFKKFFSFDSSSISPINQERVSPPPIPLNRSSSHRFTTLEPVFSLAYYSMSIPFFLRLLLHLPFKPMSISIQQIMDIVKFYHHRNLRL